jgi:hypothetical protein
MVEKEIIKNQNNLTVSYFDLFDIYYLPDYTLNSVTLETKEPVKFQHLNETYIWRNENVALNDFKDFSQLTIKLTYNRKNEQILKKCRQ